MNRLQILKALAHPARMDMLAWLKEPQKHFGALEHPMVLGVCANQFQKIGLAQSTVSSHLATLSAAGLVTTTRVGQWIFYKRDEAAIASFLKELASAL